MIQIIKELNIEVSKPNVFQAVVAKQYDMNTRFIKATFVDYGEKITIPQSATLKVVINALRNDGLSKGFEGDINDDGTVTVPLHSWMLELVGTVVCDISVVDTAEDDEKKLTTTSFTLIVEKAAWGGDGITSDPQGDVLIELLNRVEAAGELAEDALRKSTEANSVYDRMVEATRASEAIVNEWQYEISSTNGRIDELVAMRPANVGPDTVELDDGDVRFPFMATIVSNGVNCKIDIDLSEIELGGDEEKVSNYHAIPLNFAPMGSVSFENEMCVVTLESVGVNDDDDTADVRLSFKNKTDSLMSMQTVSMYYPVLQPSVPEVSDIRVGVINGNGTTATYPTAGQAVREQVWELHNRCSATEGAVFDLEEVPPSANLWNPDTAEYREISVGLMGYYNIIPCTVDDHFWVRTTDDRSVTDVDNHSVMLAISIIGANGVKVSCGANQWYQREVSFFAENGYLSAIDEVVAIEIGVRENQIPDGNPANVMVVFSDTTPTEFIPYFEGGVVKHSRIAPLQEQVDGLVTKVEECVELVNDFNGDLGAYGRRVEAAEKAIEENAAAVDEQLAEMQEKVDTAGSGRVKIRNTPIEDLCSKFTYLLHGKDKVESFLFFTDPHLASRTLNYEDLTPKYVDPMKVYYDATPTSFALSGGDTIHENATAEDMAYPLVYVDKYMRKTFDRYYTTIGNHDDNFRNIWDDPEMFSSATIRNLTLRQEENLYYSFDGVNSKGYVLNSTDGNGARAAADREMTAYRWEQIDWLANRLKEDDADNSFLLYHAGCVRKNDDPSLGVREPSAISREVLKLCDAYNKGATVTLNGVDYDFTGCTGCVRFILSGHVHDADSVEVFDCNIPIILTYNLRRLGEQGKGDNPTFDLCLADYDNEMLYMKRVGDGRDRDVLMGSRTYSGNTYRVKLNLTDVNVSNNAVLAREGTAYENTLTVPYGYARDTVVVTMGGVDITATAHSGGQISIGSVTGDITITATAIEPNYTNLADPTSSDWVRGGMLQWAELKIAANYDTYTVTNYIPVTMGDVLRFKGFDSETKMSGGVPPMLVYYDENKEYVTAQSLIDGLPPTAEPNEDGVIAHTMVVRNTDLDGNGLYDDQFTYNDICTRAKYVRISGIRTVPADEIVITVNEEIE